MDPLKSSLKKLRKKLFGRISLLLALKFPSRRTIRWMKNINSIQLSVQQIQALMSVIQHFTPGNVLVFGVGNDSPFWQGLNSAGDTLFLEDNREWLQMMQQKYASLDIHQVVYDTRLQDWQQLLTEPDGLMMSLPRELHDVAWDLIFVDAPAGFSDSSPGRMKSIYTASRLATPGTHIFVHDCHRIVEQTYSDAFLGQFHLQAEHGGSPALLRHYVCPV